MLINSLSGRIIVDKSKYNGTCTLVLTDSRGAHLDKKQAEHVIFAIAENAGFDVTIENRQEEVTQGDTVVRNDLSDPIEVRPRGEVLYVDEPTGTAFVKFGNYRPVPLDVGNLMVVCECTACQMKLARMM